MKANQMQRIKRNIPLHLMLLPGVVLMIIFAYIPMYGVVIAFQDFVPAKGLFGDQVWIGLDNFRVVFTYPKIWEVLQNTLWISIWKIILSVVVPVTFALMLNEVKNKIFKRSVQTIIYFPYFLSWVVFAGILIDVLSPGTGILNTFITSLGFEPIYFLGNASWFPTTIITTDVFKTFGFNTVIYLAAMSGINPELYDVSSVDGANKIQQMWYVTLPGIKIIVILLTVLGMGNILNAGFDQVWNLLNNNVLSSGEILDTYVYRQGILARLYGQGAAIALMKSVVSMGFIGSSYYIAYKFLNYRLF
jgi:putative aldouronate transport system permease protein